ncbi:MAG: TolC family protein [Planctomycetes bacterium]|nr:TolC family protein [Planctomycetota bacterium]
MRAAALLLLASCAAPVPLPLREVEERDRAFRPPAAGRTDEIVRQESLGVEDALQLADALNPQLASERARIDLATAAIWEARLHPNPAFVVSVEDWRPSGGGAKAVAGVEVPIVFGGRIGAAESAAAAERDAEALRYLWRRREILSEVKRAFVAVLTARRVADLARETRDLAKALHDATEERFKARAVPEMELLKAAVNLAKAETDLRVADKEIAVSVKALQVAIGNADLPRDRFAGALAGRFAPPPLETLLKLDAHPLLAAAAKDRDAAELRIALAKAERFPDIGLEVTGGVDPDGEAIVQGGLRVPLPLFNRNQAKIAEAEIRLRQADLRIRQARNDLILRLTEAYRNLTAAQERVTAYTEEILPKARQALDQTNEGYARGKFGYLDVLDAQRTLAEAKSVHAAALAELNYAAVELEKLTGTNLERR